MWGPGSTIPACPQKMDNWWTVLITITLAKTFFLPPTTSPRNQSNPDTLKLEHGNSFVSLMVDHVEVKAGKIGFWSGSLFFFQLLCIITKRSSTYISQHLLKFQECYWFETIYLHYKQVVHYLCLSNWIHSIRLLVWFFFWPIFGYCSFFFFLIPLPWS